MQDRTHEELEARCAELESKLRGYERWVSRAAQVCRSAARGDLEPRLLRVDVGGELGELLHSINHLLDLTDAFVREAGATLEHAASDRYFRRLHERGLDGSFRRASTLINQATSAMSAKNDALKEAREQQLRLADEFETNVASVVERVVFAAGELHETADILGSSVRRTDDVTASTRDAAEEVAQNMQSIASASEELSASIREISHRVEASTSAAREARESSDGSRARVAHLTESSDRIGSVVGMIAKVAAQTNLLALNAGIEAARAGEVGRGFAVVANEVKELSGQTRSATQEIENQVEGVRGATGTVAEAIDAMASTLQRVEGGAAEIESAIQAQNEVTQEVSRSTQAASQGALKVTEGINAVGEAARATSGAADGVVRSACELSDLADRLRAEVGAFLDAVRN